MPVLSRRSPAGARRHVAAPEKRAYPEARRPMFVALILIGALVLTALAASVVMSRAGNRSALWSVGLGAVLAPAVLAAAVGVATLVVRTELPFPSLFRAEPTAVHQRITVNVLVLNYDPVLREDGQRLHEALGWNDPRALAEGYVRDVERASGGSVRFRIVDWRDLDTFHRKRDGFVYTAPAYLRSHRRGRGWHQPDAADYHSTFSEQQILPLIDDGRVDEVWFFGGPYFGYSEAAMAGPGAFDVNGEVFADVAAKRAFVIMGFNYERGIAEMLENLCHRVEATMSRVYGGWRAERLDHDWARFAANQVQSGTAAVGTCHWPPNAAGEYDFDNPDTVMSSAADWLTYPKLTGRREAVNRETWGGPDFARNYFRWWFRHLPRSPGQGADARQHNWWKYVFAFNDYDASGRGVSGR